MPEMNLETAKKLGYVRELRESISQDIAANGSNAEIDRLIAQINQAFAGVNDEAVDFEGFRSRVEDVIAGKSQPCHLFESERPQSRGPEWLKKDIYSSVPQNDKLAREPVAIKNRGRFRVGGGLFRLGAAAILAITSFGASRFSVPEVKPVLATTRIISSATQGLALVPSSPPLGWDFLSGFQGLALEAQTASVLAEVDSLDLLMAPAQSSTAEMEMIIPKIDPKREAVVTEAVQIAQDLKPQSGIYNGWTQTSEFNYIKEVQGLECTVFIVAAHLKAGQPEAVEGFQTYNAADWTKAVAGNSGLAQFWKVQADTYLPKPGDLVVIQGGPKNYGHVALVTDVSESGDRVWVAQANTTASFGVLYRNPETGQLFPTDYDASGKVNQDRQDRGLSILERLID